MVRGLSSAGSNQAYTYTTLNPYLGICSETCALCTVFTLTVEHAEGIASLVLDTCVDGHWIQFGRPGFVAPGSSEI